MKAARVRQILGAGVLGWALVCHGASAQDYDRPPGDVQDSAGSPQSEAGSLAIRIDRLESSLRRATGQIEELQNQNQKLQEQLRKFREDVEFRLSGKTGGVAPSTSVGAAEPAPAPAPTRTSRRKGDDVFDPDANPNAPGAPKLLGTTQPSAPMTLPSHVAADETPPAMRPLPTPPPAEKPVKPNEEPTFVSSGVPFSDSKEQFKSAVAAYNAGQYAVAEAQFKAYLDANKAAANAPEAIYFIGETYMQRARPREAAEQYLKVSTEYPKSPKAPESMVRLGLALAKLGNMEQACATFAEVGKRFPRASAVVKKSADREAQSHRCT